MSDLSVAEVLDKAADLIEPEGAWTQGAYARDESGFSVGDNVQSGICWCAVGAIAMIKGVTGHAAHNWEIDHTIPGIESLGFFNDAPSRTQSEVVSALRQAADLLRGQEGR